MIHYHHQNLDQRTGDRWNASGHIWRHGRAWLKFGRSLRLQWSWNLWSHFCSLEVSCSDENGLTLFVAFPPFAFWLSAYVRRLHRWYAKYDWRRLGAHIFNWAIWVQLWADDSCWSPHERFWHPHRRRFTWYPLDTLLGQGKHAVEREVTCEPIVVAMPEASYRGTVKLEVETWKRPRWPWWPSATRIVRAHIDMQDPIPFPGKGESSWDCGEDAVYGLTCPATSVPEAITAITRSVLQSRRNHGGTSWVPEKRGDAQPVFSG